MIVNETAKLENVLIPRRSSWAYPSCGAARSSELVPIRVYRHPSVLQHTIRRGAGTRPVHRDHATRETADTRWRRGRRAAFEAPGERDGRSTGGQGHDRDRGRIGHRAGDAIRFAEEGARVTCVDVDRRGCRETVGEIGERRSRSSRTSRMRPWSRPTPMPTVGAGRPRCRLQQRRVNLPGIFHEASDEVVDRTLDVNVKGAIYGCRYAIPHMLRGGGGSLINTSSVNGLVAEPFLAIYATSKGAIVMLSRRASRSTTPTGIRCNAMAPGWVDTPANYAHAEMLGGLRGGLRDDRFLPADRPARRAAGDRQRGALPGLGRVVVHDRLGRRRGRWDDREVTIPGSTVPGRRTRRHCGGGGLR